VVVCSEVWCPLMLGPLSALLLVLLLVLLVPLCQASTDSLSPPNRPQGLHHGHKVVPVSMHVPKTGYKSTSSSDKMVKKKVEKNNNSTGIQKNGYLYKKQNYNDDNRPLFLLHVGPHKTGTTHFQEYLIKRYTKQTLQKHNIDIWPNFYEIMCECIDKGLPNLNTSSKKLHWTRNKLLTHFISLWTFCPRFHQNIETFLLKSSIDQKTIVFCHEDWAGDVLLHAEKYKSFFEVVAKYFRIQVVINYRLPVNRYVSIYNEVLKSTLSNGYWTNSDTRFKLFSDFFNSKTNADGSHGVIKNQIDFYRNVIEQYSTIISKYNHSSISIIDYYGVRARESEGVRLDLNYVIMCRILGVMCQRKKAFSDLSTIGANPSVPEAPLQMAVLFVSYAWQNNCVLPQGSGKLVSSLMHHKWDSATPIPLAIVNMSAFTVASLLEDLHLRKTYGANFLIGNRTANVLQATMYHTEVDHDAVFKDKKWQNQFSTLLDNYRTKGLCGVAQ
jgi:hypothetical protein